MTPDQALINLSKAGTRLGDATRAVWARQAEYDEAARTGDDFDLLHASLALTTASRDHERRKDEYEAAGAALRALAEAGEL